MTIDEAIKILGDLSGLGEHYDYDDLEAAEKLGIEALKEIKAFRAAYNESIHALLPGETEGIKGDKQNATTS